MANPLIMVVEDEVSYAQKIAETLTATGKYEAVTANSAKDAFAILQKQNKFFNLFKNPVRLILLDIKMPDMDGLQFLSELRKKFAAEQIGVIMVTAYEDESKWDKATDGWVVGYITKPFDPSVLLSAVNRFFSDPEAYVEMTIDTFEKHIEKKEEFRQKKSGT
jgi:two-component system chemotaxis response regulator CheY